MLDDPYMWELLHGQQVLVGVRIVKSSRGKQAKVHSAAFMERSDGAWLLSGPICGATVFACQYYPTPAKKGQRIRSFPTKDKVNCKACLKKLRKWRRAHGR